MTTNDKPKGKVRACFDWTMRLVKRGTRLTLVTVASIMVIYVLYSVSHINAIMANLMKPIVIVPPTVANMETRGNDFLDWVSLKWHIVSDSKPIEITRKKNGEAIVVTSVNYRKGRAIFTPTIDNSGKFRYMQASALSN